LKTVIPIRIEDETEEALKELSEKLNIDISSIGEALILDYLRQQQDKIPNRNIESLIQNFKKNH
jgi:Ribbon-helix-helix protein, copG family.